MGGIASVHVRAPQPFEPSEDETAIQNTEMETIGQTQSSGGGENQSKVLEVHVTSSLPLEEREAEMGRVIQFLAEENVSLKRKLLECHDATSEEAGVALVQPEIYGESSEQKIARLENTLAAERKEKWTAIKQGEQYRVDLVNCRSKLVQVGSINKKLEDELRLVQSQAIEFHERLSCSEEIEKGRNSGRSSSSRESDIGDQDMRAFREQLKEKRDARQKAIAAKSLEINQMRDDLKRERVLRERLERELHRLKKCRSDTAARGNEGTAEIQFEKENLLDEIAELKQSLNATTSIKDENKKLLSEIKTLNHEIRQLNTELLQRENDMNEANRKYERLLRDQNELEKENERSRERQKEIEEEQKKIWSEYDNEKREIAKRTLALKDVIAISRQMLVIREKQVVDLKKKLREIEDSLLEKQRLEDSVLKVEYEKQLENIKLLKALYEERLNLMEAERKKLEEKITDGAKLMDDLRIELNDLNAKYVIVGEELDTEKQGNITLTKELDNWVAQAHSYERELSVMNNLLTQMLVGPHGTDLDKLLEQLRQNHQLIAEITTCEDCSDVASSLPKLLLDLITKVEDSGEKQVESDKVVSEPGSYIKDPMTDSTDTISEQSEGLLVENAGAVLPIVSYRNATVFKPPVSPPLISDENENPNRASIINETNEDEEAPNLFPTAQAIVNNLPKVWKVLTELLSHHKAVEGVPLGDERNCYKSVDTPNGPRNVISVSSTFLRLKDLILEKKYLQKEVYRLKHLNSHLESRLDDQEKRLSIVRCELHKTWGVVGRMRAQHQQLHNQEKILRYELQEKRVMLTELKQELEYCRDKWDRARKKNNESETEWKKLRKEFNARKLADAGLQESAESGYSDEQNDSDDAARSTPSPVDFLNAAKVLEVVSSQPVSSIDVVVSDQEIIISYDMEQQMLDRNESTAAEDWIGSVPNEPGPATQTETPLTNIDHAQTTEGNNSTDGAESYVNLSEPLGRLALVTDEERERAREERARRLQRLEDQCQLLVRKVDITTHKSNFLSNRLEELHEQYGGSSTESASEASTSGQSEGTRCQEELRTCTLGLRKESSSDSNFTQNERVDESLLMLEKTEANQNAADVEIHSECPDPDVHSEKSLNSQSETFPKLKADNDQSLEEGLNGSSASTVVENTEQSVEASILANAFEQTCNTIGGQEAIEISAEGTSTNGIKSTEDSNVKTEQFPLATFDERMAARAAKLKRLEEQCSKFLGKVSNTVQRGGDLSNRLEEVHNSFVNNEALHTSSIQASSVSGENNEGFADTEDGAAGITTNENTQDLTNRLEKDHNNFLNDEALHTSSTLATSVSGGSNEGCGDSNDGAAGITTNEDPQSNNLEKPNSTSKKEHDYNQR